MQLDKMDLLNVSAYPLDGVDNNQSILSKLQGLKDPKNVFFWFPKTIKFPKYTLLVLRATQLFFNSLGSK